MELYAAEVVSQKYNPTFGLYVMGRYCVIASQDDFGR